MNKSLDEKGLNNSDLLVKQISFIRHTYYALVINPFYVLGMLGNLLSIAIFYRLGNKRSCNSGSHLYLIWLAVFDLLYCIFMFEYTGFAWKLSALEDFSNVLCALLFYLRGISGHSAGLIFCAFSVDRLLSVQRAFQLLDADKPISNRSRQITKTIAITFQNKTHSTNRYFSLRKLKNLLKKREMAITLCIILSSLATLPRLLSFRLLEKENNHVSCMARKETKGYTILHMALHLCIQRIGPGLIIFTTNVLIYRRLRKTVNNCSILIVSQRAKSELKLVKACAILGVVFLLLSVPPGIHWTIIYSWILQISGPYPSWLHVHFLIGDMESITASLNSVVNFFVYMLILDYFRAEFIQTICSGIHAKFNRSTYSNKDFDLRMIEATTINQEAVTLSS